MADMNAAVAHVVLGVVSSNSLSNGFSGNGFSGFSDHGYVHPGMHVNLLIHAVLGGLKFSGNGSQLEDIYKISLAASKFLPLPCLMADLYRGFGNNSDLIRAAHVLTGIVPLFLVISGKENEELGKVCIAVNIISLCYHSLNSNHNWGWFTAGAAVFAYFLAEEQLGAPAYPLGLALMEYCAHRVSVWVF